MKILCTGGSGFVGSAFVKRLVADGHKVRVLDDGSRGAVRRLSSIMHKIEFMRGDIRISDNVSAACNGMDEVCHLAFVNGTENFYKKPEVVLDVGVRGMINVLDACAANDVKRLFLVSSSEVYQTPPMVPTSEEVPMVIPDPHNPRYSYAAGKIISEVMALHSKIFDHLVIVRPHNIYGPDMGEEHVIPQLARKIRHGEVLYFQGDEPTRSGALYGGQQTRAFCYIDDCIDGFMIAHDKGGHREIYNVGTPEETSIIDLAHRISHIIGKGVDVHCGMESDGGTLRRCPDISKLAALGYQPKVPLSAGLPLALAWYQEKQIAVSSL